MNTITEDKKVLDIEKFFPISVNPNLCITCMKCTVRCPSKAAFFKGKARYIDYNKCQGCLRCVDACKRGAIEVISLKEGKLTGIEILNEKCIVCVKCTEPDFCFQNLFEIKVNESNEKVIQFRKGDFSLCRGCLKCFKDCPYNAIIPIIE